MAYLSVRGVDHYYEWIKTPSDSQKKAVMVFVHGWAGSGRYWQSTAKALSHKFDCLLYDMRGFGRSLSKSQSLSPSSNATYELEEYAHDLAVLIDELQLGEVYINAHSMGTSIVTLFLNRYPQRVKKAILTCAGIFEYDKKAFEAFYKFGGYVVKFRPKWLSKIPFADQMFMARFLHRSISRSDRQDFLEDFLLADYDAALGTIFTCVSKQQAESMPSEYAQIKVPTLLISGEFDQIIPAKLGQNAALLNNYVEFSLISQTAHFPMLEDSETYLERVCRFLE
jgi:pimeloyl-ACP methyl ester carboxylesterase